MYLQLQRIKRAGACDDLNDCEPGGLFAVDEASLAVDEPYMSLAERTLHRRLRGSPAAPSVASVLGKRRPSRDVEPDSPKTPGSPGVAAFARSFAAAARKRQALRLGKLARRAAGPRGARARGRAPPPPPAVDEPSPRLMAKAKPCAATIALADIRNLAITA
ncbi:hypothetical protein SO694_00069165 [Aureococcus anophagefferens]|uniref:Uncharacterized protein n=1 Tax=Aureococcus anophagefferens TaxID=44056 RepID=A0ABR1FQ25_AURAN